MSKQNRRRLSWGLVIGILGVVTLLVLQGTGVIRSDHQAHAQEAERELSDAEMRLIARTHRLRQVLQLGNQDLAAMGLSESQATAVLQKLKGWAETHLVRLDQAEQAVQSSRQAVRETWRQIQVGPRDDNRSRQLLDQKQLAGEVQGRQSALMAEAVSQVTVELTADQRRIWEAARVQRSMPGLLRYVPDLTERQRASVLQSSSGSGSEFLTTQLATLKNQVSQRIEASLAGVQAAEAEVLPKPADLDRHGTMTHPRWRPAPDVNDPITE